MFIKNAGQWVDGARFQVWGGPGGSMWLAEDGIWITVLDERRRTEDEQQQLAIGISSLVGWPLPARPSSPQAASLHLSFVGANSQPRLQPFDRLDSKISYFIGDDPGGWRPDVPVWGGVRYVDLYPGVDLELSSAAGRWTWRAVADDQAALSQVRLEVDGSEGLSLQDDLLWVTTAVGEIGLPLMAVDVARPGPGSEPARPQAALVGHTLALPFAASSHPAVPDARQDNPDDLLYSSFLGGSAWDTASATVVDERGSVMVAGTTYSWNFPGALGAPVAGGYVPCDLFVARFSRSGASLVYGTFLGGSGYDYGYGLAVDSEGSGYVTGTTYSSDFPTTAEAYEREHHGRADAYVTKLNSAGTGLLYSTYLGGSSYDWGEALALDGEGNAYITGSTESDDFPTTEEARMPAYRGGGDSFIVKLDSAGRELVYSTYLGGGAFDSARSIAVDRDGNAYVAGQTGPLGFPTTAGAYDRTRRGGADVFVTKLNAEGSRLAYSTRLGGSGSEGAQAIGLDGGGNAYVTGVTTSDDFPMLEGAYDADYQGLWDTFVVKFDAQGSNLAYSTYLGGSGHDVPQAIAVDSAGSAYVTGYTTSDDFPTTPGAYDTSPNGRSDAFVVMLDRFGTELTTATYLGGTQDDRGAAIALDALGHVVLAGDTSSGDFPTTEWAYDQVLSGQDDAFVARLAVPSPAPLDAVIWLPLLISES
ncbi:MAG TPA: SBBP repeat-containing protein [Anaerolineae bacterium]|nr:SBBP repeat-containing protein [Anaerolineae bacterium]